MTVDAIVSQNHSVLIFACNSNDISNTARTFQVAWNNVTGFHIGKGLRLVLAPCASPILSHISWHHFLHEMPINRLAPFSSLVERDRSLSLPWNGQRVAAHTVQRPLAERCGSGCRSEGSGDCAGRLSLEAQDESPCRSTYRHGHSVQQDQLRHLLRLKHSAALKSSYKI